MDISLYRLTSLEGVPVEKLVCSTVSTSSRKEVITVLKEVMRPIRTPLRNRSEKKSEVSLKAGKIWRCFPKLVSYRCDIPEAKDTSVFPQVSADVRNLSSERSSLLHFS